jgi:hypothetical protein
MGFSSTAATVTLTAKLTPFGRQQLLANSSTLITNFALGDSDANYRAELPLGTGEIPVSSGNLSVNGNSNNSVNKHYRPKSILIADSLGNNKKLVEIGSTNIVNSEKLLGQTTISGTSVSHNIVDRTDTATDPLVNLWSTFKLPITTADDTIFTVTQSIKGGYADTSLSGVSTNTVLIIGLDHTLYGESLDGKAIKVDIETTATTHTLYGAYEKTLTSTKVQDARVRDESFNSAIFGGNVTFLFSDTIQKPNNDTTLSWATGYATAKPYSINSKQQFNLLTNTLTSTVSDTLVGIAYLDKGFVVITHPDIVDNFTTGTGGTATATTVSFNSMVTEVTQEITCIAGRGQFTSSNNPTFDAGDTPRISEVLLMDNSNNIIAVAKSERHIEKNPQQFLALGIKITV